MTRPRQLQLEGLCDALYALEQEGSVRSWCTYTHGRKPHRNRRWLVDGRSYKTAEVETFVLAMNALSKEQSP